MRRDEKVDFLSGADMWTTKAIPRFGIPSVWMADGPHGLRKTFASADIGTGGSHPATCFPTASALASSWDPELIERIGAAIGREAAALDVQLLLGPGLNLKRSPLGGRNFEYYSEDPVLSGRLAAAFVRGVQSQGVGACIKHFAVNNQETRRFSISAEVDERTLHELYLRGFEIAIRESEPWAVMAAYNRVNGIYATEHRELLTDILRDTWGYRGFVVSDWFAVDDRGASHTAGLDLRMPNVGPADDALTRRAVTEGALDETAIDRAARTLLAFVLRADGLRDPSVVVDLDAHHRLAREAAARSVVLLDNDGTLPLDASDLTSIAILGAFAESPRYQGAGSSLVQSTRVDTALDTIGAYVGDAVTVRSAAGYGDDEAPDEALVAEAVDVARNADVAIVFAGLPPGFESEGFDRQHLDLPASHTALIEAVAAAQPRTVVVLANGSAVVVPWRDRVAAVVESWLGGQAGAGGVADVLFGLVNPSGKLAETFPKRLEDTPAYLDFPGDQHTVRHGEGQYIGYRHYDARSIEPLYPFGHGLSYTTFAYTRLEIEGERAGREPVTARVTVENTGSRAGEEIVQLYIRHVDSTARRPEHELRAFGRVSLAAGASTTLDLTLEPRDFAVYDSRLDRWTVVDGEVELLVGGSSRRLPLRQIVRSTPAEPPRP
ncbi:MAG: glycoside hydrolase family 3 C-terminal domain-containing protein, partial [Acidobacteriota bacterium]